MATRRKSALVAIAVTAICALWVGLIPAPASASPGTGMGTAVEGEVGESVELVSTTTATAGDGMSANADHVCGTHNWYYRIYIIGSGQTLFRWAFRTEYCYFPNSYWFVFTPTNTVELRHTSIRGSTVAGKILSVNGIHGSLINLYEGMTFQYCPNNVCRQTFTPRLAYGYALSGTRVYLGDVPLR